MKLKSLDRTARIAWSPVGVEQLYLIAGTAAVKLDETFSTASAVELCEIDCKDTGGNVKIVGAIPAAHRFHKIVWGSYGMGSAEMPLGMVVAGCETGLISLYNPSKIAQHNNSAALMHQSRGHSGPVRALALNSFKTELLASGSGNSEIFIWDLHKPDVMMSPGPKSHLSENVSSVAWNGGVTQILGSVTPSKALIWDLRKGDGPIVTVGDSAGVNMSWREMCWHPAVTTSLCLASDQDLMPIIQHWDLRYATAPILQLDGHQRGVVAIDWCKADPNLLISSAKDGKVYIWNPNTGQFLSEVVCGGQGAFQAAWCHKNPFLIGLSTYDRIQIETVVGCSCHEEEDTTPSLSESFPGIDFSLRRSVEQCRSPPTLLPNPPSWMRCPIGARFSFGGTLVTFNNVQSTDPNFPPENSVSVERVTSDVEFCDRAAQLIDAIKQNQLTDYCRLKSEEAEADIEKKLWEFMMVNAGSGSWQQFATALGYNPDEIEKKVDFCAEHLEVAHDSSSSESEPESESDVESLARQVDQQLTVDEKTEKKAPSPFDIPVDESFDGVLCQAVMCGKFDNAVHLCIAQRKWSLALILASLADENLFPYCVRKYLRQSGSSASKVIDAVYCQKWSDLVNSTDLNSWVETLCCLLANVDAISQRRIYIDLLARRLETDSNKDFQKFSAVCHIVSGNLEGFSNIIYNQFSSVTDSSTLHKMVEFVSMLAFSLQHLNHNFKVELINDSKLSGLIGRFLFTLLEQGLLDYAYDYLTLFTTVSDQTLSVLQDRILGAVEQSKGRRKPPFPVLNILPQKARQIVKTPQPTTAYNKPAPLSYGAPVPPQLTGPFQPSATISQPPPAAFVAAKPLIEIKQPSQLPTTPGLHTHISGAIAGHSQRERYPSSGYDSTAKGYPSVQSSYTSGGSMGPAYPGIAQMPTAPYQSQVPYQQPIPQQQATTVPAPPMGHVHYSTDQIPQTNGVQPASTAQIGRRAHVGSQHRSWNDPPPISPKQHNFPVPAAFHSTNNNVDQPEAVTEAKAPPSIDSIPESHRVIKLVFDRLIQLCYERADNPHAKKKLEDVGMKLETELYPMLRLQKLANASLMGLHHIVNSVEATNYAGALESHRQMVQSEDFPQLASFMPSLKVLLHSASQLNVFYGN